MSIQSLRSQQERSIHLGTDRCPILLTIATTRTLWPAPLVNRNSALLSSPLLVILALDSQNSTKKPRITHSSDIEAKCNAWGHWLVVTKAIFQPFQTVGQSPWHLAWWAPRKEQMVLKNGTKTEMEKSIWVESQRCWRISIAELVKMTMEVRGKGSGLKLRWRGTETRYFQRWYLVMSRIQRSRQSWNRCCKIRYRRWMHF